MKDINQWTKQDYPLMGQYIARCSRWQWHDRSRIDIIDEDRNIKITLDKLQSWIFHEADGGRTVKNLLEWSAEHYRNEHKAPPDLDTTNLRTLSTLVKDLHVVTLCNEAPVLPEYYLNPNVP